MRNTDRSETIWK